MTKLQPHLIGPKSTEELCHEYYWLSDRRHDGQALGKKGWYDDAPERTKRLVFQYQQRMKTDQWKSDCSREGGIDSLRLLDSELPPTVAFRRPAPKKPIAHHTYIRVRSPILSLGIGFEVYEVVSSAWRDAVESVEPAIHEFHPLAIRFEDATYHNFIFRPMQFGEVVDLTRSDSDTLKGKPFSLNSFATHITLLRNEMGGRHYVRYRLTHVFVSRLIAAKLKPLLPASCYLQPVDIA